MKPEEITKKNEEKLNEIAEMGKIFTDLRNVAILLSLRLDESQKETDDKSWKTIEEIRFKAGREYNTYVDPQRLKMLEEAFLIMSRQKDVASGGRDVGYQLMPLASRIIESMVTLVEANQRFKEAQAKNK